MTASATFWSAMTLSPLCTRAGALRLHPATAVASTQAIAANRCAIYVPCVRAILPRFIVQWPSQRGEYPLVLLRAELVQVQEKTRRLAAPGSEIRTKGSLLPTLTAAANRHAGQAEAEKREADGLRNHAEVAREVAPI